MKVEVTKELLAAHPVAPGVPEGFRLEKLYEPERIKVEKIGGGFCCFCKTGSGGVETAAFEFLNAMLSASPSLATERDALAGFDVGELADVAEGLENGYEKTVNVGNVTGEGDAHLETATAYAARFIRAYLEAALQSQPASAEKDAEDARRWISITDRLPEPNQVVCLVDENRWRNTGGDFDVNVHACGYLASVGHQMYWSCFSEPRGLTLDAFTHWTPVPAISAIAQQVKAKVPLTPYEFIVSGISCEWYLRREVDALLAAQQKGAEGWVLVPKEPTEEMISAAFVGKVMPQSVSHQIQARARMAGDYKTMIAAAPLPNGEIERKTEGE